MIDSHTDDVLAALAAAKARAMEACGMAMESNAKAITPVRTGNLRNSVTHASNEERAIVGTNVEYAPHVELGTKVQKSKPYLVPAVRDNLPTYKRIIQRELSRP